MSSKAIDQIIAEIETYVTEHNEQYFSARIIAANGWLMGAKYASVKKLIDRGLIKSFELFLGETSRNPIRKVHYKDLEEYIVNSYKN